MAFNEGKHLHPPRLQHVQQHAVEGRVDLGRPLARLAPPPPVAAVLAEVALPEKIQNQGKFMK